MKRVSVGIVTVILCAAPVGALSQSMTQTPIKQGLWQMDSSSTTTMSIPADMEAKLAAMPAAQQAQVRAMMGGSSAKPVAVSNKSCVAGQTTMDSMLNDQQQNGAMKCTFTNRVATADGASFDTNCTSPQGTATGHTQIHMADSEHVNGTTNLTVDSTTNGRSMHMTAQNTFSAKYLSADCGNVKPNLTPPPGK